ncbi:hypothetical protein LVJ94_09480 [Pendulispora rubella]|uniref:Uncharacterized protein n=1 Tax=Pendulispora rubella TaxID=2741070 RepID=A0ABZ2L950_9BACT
MKSPHRVPTDQASLALFGFALVVLVSPLRYVWLRADAPWWTAFVVGFGLVALYGVVVWRGVR